MAAPPLPKGAARRNAGFALIIVLWTLVLIAFIVAHLVGTGRTEIRIAENLAANAVTEAAADGAVNRAIFELLDPDPRRRWAFDGSMHRVTIGNCQVSVRVYDEAAKINPSLAAPALLETLLRVTGSNPETARRIAAAIGEWVGASGAARSQSALTAQYREAGRDYAPPGEPLERLDELRRVIGMTPAAFAALRPHLSLFAPPQPDVTHADPVVREVMMALSQGRPASASPAPPSGIFTARIEATASGPGRARTMRTAIVRIVPGSRVYTVLAWGGGSN